MSWFDKATLPGNADQDVQLPVGRRNQETNMWCWAASGQMVMEYLGVSAPQCDQANKEFGLSSCCQSPVPGECVQGGWPEFNKYGFNFQRTSSYALSWDQIVDQISSKRAPFTFTWAWDGGGGHMMSIYGYAVISGIRYVHMHDPWPPNVGATNLITYDAYVAGPGYSHWDDFYDVSKYYGPWGGGAGGMNDIVPGQKSAIAAAREGANQTLEVMRRALGLTGPGAPDVPKAVEEGIAVSVLRLDELKAVAPPAPGAPDASTKLLDRPPTQVVYPVRDGAKKLQGEIVMAQTGNEWKQLKFGSPAISQMVARVSPPAPGAAPTDAAIITVPALNQHFLVTLDGPASKKYAPLIDDPPGGFRATDRLTAAELMQKLVAAAKSHTNTPR